jgi:hypothetical protein
LLETESVLVGDDGMATLDVVVPMPGVVRLALSCGDVAG